MELPPFRVIKSGVGDLDSHRDRQCQWRRQVKPTLDHDCRSPFPRPFALSAAAARALAACLILRVKVSYRSRQGVTTTLCDCYWAVVQCRPRTKSECPFVDLPVRNLGEITHTRVPTDSAGRRRRPLVTECNAPGLVSRGFWR